MKPLLIEQLKELNSIYCLIIIDNFEKINFKKLVLANFILKYPVNLIKFDSQIYLSELEKENVSTREKFKFQDSWDKLTLDSLKILISKNLILYKDDLISKSELTDICLKKIEKFEEFDSLSLRTKIIKKKFEKISEEEIIKIING